MVVLQWDETDHIPSSVCLFVVMQNKLHSLLAGPLLKV